MRRGSMATRLGRLVVAATLAGACSRDGENAERSSGRREQRSEQSGHQQRSALLVTLDTTRADALSCYGNAEETTPVLDALAAEGVLFEAAHTVTALTLPAHASMLTGLYPPRHGLRDNALGALADAAPTVAERARAAGLDTAAFVSSVVLARDFGLAQGFDTYSTPRRRGAAESAHGAERPASETVDAALAWLAERPDDRDFFLWIHLYDPHHPYAPPAPFAGRHATPYLGEVAVMDAEIGRVLDALRARGLDERTFVLALADHGEALGEHGELTHGAFCYQGTLRIPLIARWPRGAPQGGRTSGTRSQELVGAADVAPTLVEALGLAPLDDVDGLSFFAARLPEERGLYFESYYGFLAYGWSPLAGWMDARGKYLHSSTPELYDWRADPAERADLVSARPDEVARARAAIERVAAASAYAPAARGGDDDEALTGIQALGYAGGGDAGAGALPHPLAPSPRPSPRSQASFFAQQVRAQELSAAGNDAEAATIWETVLAATPENTLALEKLASTYLALGRAGDAVSVLERLVRLRPDSGRSQHLLGLALLAADRPANAVAPLRRAVELTQGRRRYREVLREALTRLGREAELDERDR